MHFKSFLDLLTSVWLVNSRTFTVLTLCITWLIWQITGNLIIVRWAEKCCCLYFYSFAFPHTPRMKPLRIFYYCCGAATVNGSCWDQIAKILLTIAASIIYPDFQLNYRLRFYIFQLMFVTAISPKYSHEFFERDEMLDIFLCDEKFE